MSPIHRRRLLPVVLVSLFLSTGVASACDAGRVIGMHADGTSAGIAGVRVSDGRHIVETGADGRFEGLSGRAAPVFVIKPADWTLPREGANPAFWRAAGSRGEACTFTLQAGEAAGTLDVAVFADPQTGTTRWVTTTAPWSRPRVPSARSGSA